MSVNLDGERLRGSASKSEAAARHLDESRAKLERAASGAQKAWQESITQASAQATSAISTARDQAVQSIEKAAADAGAVVTARVVEESDRAEKLRAVSERIDKRHVWSSVAALAIAAMPWAMIVAGVWMTVAALTTGWGWVLEAGLGPWAHIGRGLVVILGTAGALWALVLTGRWVTALVGAWRGRELPRWPELPSWLRSKR